jgi:hypothetical protein
MPPWHCRQYDRPCLCSMHFVLAMSDCHCHGDSLEHIWLPVTSLLRISIASPVQEWEGKGQASGSLCVLLAALSMLRRS